MTAAEERTGQGRHRGLGFRELSQRCEQQLQDLNLELPVPTIEAFFHALGTRLDRRFILCPMDTPTGMCGLWVETIFDFDVFFYERDTTPLHRALMLGHEAAHLVFGHHSAKVTREVAARLLGLDVRLVRRVLARTTYTDEQERLAEVFGTLVAQRAVRPVVPAQPPVDPEVAELLARMQAALGGSGASPAGR